MNFDELKDAWAREPVAGVALPRGVAARTGSAVMRIRRSMRLEFVWVTIGYSATLVYVVLLGPTRFSFLVICAGSFVIVQTVYYFVRFFLFYRRIGRFDLGLRKHLRRFVYELELNMELYKGYAFCVTPVVFLLWIALMDAGGRTGFLRSFLCGDGVVGIGVGSMLGILGMLFLAQAVGVLFLHRRVWVRYGRYLVELKKLVAELEDD
jgi:hypothetical protein